jgi:hypothetical protein
MSGISASLDADELIRSDGETSDDKRGALRASLRRVRLRRCGADRAGNVPNVSRQGREHVPSRQNDVIITAQPFQRNIQTHQTLRGFSS